MWLEAGDEFTTALGLYLQATMVQPRYISQRNIVKLDVPFTATLSCTTALSGPNCDRCCKWQLKGKECCRESTGPLVILSSVLACIRALILPMLKECVTELFSKTSGEALVRFEKQTDQFSGKRYA